MSSTAPKHDTPPVQLGGLLRFALDQIRGRIYEGVVAAGFDDVRPAHVTLFRWPGPDAMRPGELATATQLSKQTINDLLRELEELGYLELRRDLHDSRARIIVLSRKGRRLHRVAVEEHARAEEEWAGRIGRSRFEQLTASLRELVGDAGATAPAAARSRR